MNDCYVGAATGCLKALSITDHSFLNLNNVKELDPKKDEVLRMVWSGADQSELLLTTTGRQVKCFTSINCMTRPLFDVGGTGRVNGLYLTPNDQIVTGCHDGAVVLWDRSGNQLKELNGGQGLLCLDGSGDRVAVGGKECPVKVFDLEKGEQTWISKNVAPDNLCLRIPIWETDVKLVSNSETIVTGTGTHMIRVYDMRAQRRPVRQAEWLEEPITALSLCYRDNQVFAGNTKGEMALFDLRGRTRVLQVCKFKGQAGSIRSIHAHPNSPYVASCGIDRFARVHEITTRKLISKVYCKARLNQILMSTELSVLKQIKKEDNENEDGWQDIEEGAVSDSEEGDGSSDDDDVWADMDKKKASSKGTKQSTDDSCSEDTDDEDEGLDEEEDTDDEDEGLDEEESEDEPVPTKKIKTSPTNSSQMAKSDKDGGDGDLEIKEETISEDEDVSVAVSRKTKVETLRQQRTVRKGKRKLEI